MYSTKSYTLTKSEYNYLLPVVRDKLLYRAATDKYYLIVDTDDISDALNRLKGLYNFYDKLPDILLYRCFKDCSLDEFRKYVSTIHYCI